MKHACFVRFVGFCLVLSLIGGCTGVARHWEIAQNQDNISGYEEFLRLHPDSEFSNDAQSRLDALQRDLALWESVEKAGSLEAYKDFADKHSQSPYAERAISVIDECEADLAGRDIVDLLKERKIQVRSSGSGIENVKLELRLNVKHRVTVKIPVGTFFVCSGSAQNMVGTMEKTVVLEDDDWTSVSVDATCANRTRRIPHTEDKFIIEKSPKQKELQKLLRVLRKADASFAVRQAAVWIVTDNANYADLGTLVTRRINAFGGIQPFGGLQPSGGGTRTIREPDAARAMKICDEAGIEMTRKAIWRDRETIRRALPEGELKKWLGDRQ